MKNLNKHRDSHLSQALPVPAPTYAGQVIPLGTDGLLGIVKNARATADTVTAGTAAPGLVVGQATCELVGCAAILTLALTTPINQFQAVYYHAADNTYTNDPTNNVKVGYSLVTNAAPGQTRIAVVK